MRKTTFTGFLFKHRHSPGASNPDRVTRIWLHQDTDLTSLFEGFQAFVLACGYARASWNSVVAEFADEAASEKLSVHTEETP